MREFGGPRHGTATQIADEPVEHLLVAVGDTTHHQIPPPGERHPATVGTDRDPLAVADPLRRPVRKVHPVQRSRGAQPEPQCAAVGVDGERVDGHRFRSGSGIGDVGYGAGDVSGGGGDLDDPAVEAEHGEERVGRWRRLRLGGGLRRSWVASSENDEEERPSPAVRTPSRGRIVVRHR